jgi:hypothetical protein
VASSPDQIRSALENVASQLEADPNLAGLLPVDEIAQKCRQTAICPDDTALVSGCRLMATSLARRASSLAAEVQQRARETPGPGITPPAPSPAPVPAATQPGLPRESRPSAKPVEVNPVPAAENPTVSKPAAAARPAGERFTRASNETILDGRTRRVWLATPLPAMKHAAAASAVRQLASGGHRDWRLPTPDELAEVLGEGGLQALRALGVLPGTAAPRLWTSDLRSRFFGLLKSVGVVSGATGQASRCSPGDPAVHTLAVRGV